MQQHTIHQQRKEAGGTPCISEWFGPGEWAKLNSNIVWLNLWYLKGWNWEVSLRWIKMEFERQYDEFAGKRGAPPGKEEWLMWSAGWARGVMRVMEERGMKWGAKMQAKERLSSGASHLCWASLKGRVVKSLEWNRGAPHRGRGEDWGAPILEEECRQECSMERWMDYRSPNPDCGVPMGIEECLL